MNKCQIFILLIMAIITSGYSKNEAVKNSIQVGFTFGEIPILAKSFKPGITIQYHIFEYLSVGWAFQLKDNLQRDKSSYNAINIGLEGLTGSKETTGIRMLFSVNYRPVWWSPYLIAGFVYNGKDIETMKFDNRIRSIGQNHYNSSIEIVQSRKSGMGPAIGIGYQYDFKNNLSLNINMAMAVFNKIVTPNVDITTSSTITPGDLNMLQQKIKSVYKDNFHNKYHIFNLEIAYRLNTTSDNN